MCPNSNTETAAPNWKRVKEEAPRPPSARGAQLRTLSRGLLDAAILDRRGRIALERAVAVAAPVVGDLNGRLPHVVFVVGLGQLMAEAVRVLVRARLALLRDEGRVDRDSDDVFARRHRVLAVAAVEDEELAGEVEAVGVGPAGRDALVAGDVDRSAVVVLAGAGRPVTERGRVRVGVEHAEALLGRLPDFTRAGVDELVERVVAGGVVGGGGGRRAEGGAPPPGCVRWGRRRRCPRRRCSASSP